MDKIILTDIDGVVLNWKHAYESYMMGRGIDPLHIKDRIGKFDPKTFDIQFTNEAIKYVDEFQTDSVYRNLQPYDDANIYMAELHRLGWKFIGITACGLNPTTIEYRKDNVHKCFPEMFLHIDTVDIHGGKHECLKRYPFTYWIDDTPRHVLTGIECGHNTFWLKRFGDMFGFNPSCRVVYSWEEIYKQVIKDELGITE